MNDDITPGTPEAPKFDLFATEVEDNLKEELAKGTFQWTNKYTKVLGALLIATALVSTGVWYGHYEATKSPGGGGAALASLRAAFGGGGGGFGAGTGTGTGARAGAGTGTGAGAGAAAGAAGGFGGFGGSRITGTIKSVKGSTITITLDDPTQASSLTSGDAARITDTTTTGGAAPGGTTGGAASGGTRNGSATTGGSASSGTSKVVVPPPTTTKGATKTLATPAPSAGAGRRAGGGGAFSNPALTVCLSKAGITLTAGSRPDFQDPKTAAALQACFTQLGITRVGGFGGGAAGGAAPAPSATK